MNEQSGGHSGAAPTRASTLDTLYLQAIAVQPCERFTWELNGSSERNCRQPDGHETPYGDTCAPWSKAEDQTQGESAGTAAAAAERFRDAADPTVSRQKWPEMLLQTDKCEESSPAALVTLIRRLDF